MCVKVCYLWWQRQECDVWLMRYPVIQHQQVAAAAELEELLWQDRRRWRTEIIGVDVIAVSAVGRQTASDRLHYKATSFTSLSLSCVSAGQINSPAEMRRCASTSLSMLDRCRQIFSLRRPSDTRFCFHRLLCDSPIFCSKDGNLSSGGEISWRQITIHMI